MRTIVWMLALSTLVCAQEAKRPRITGVAHIALRVTDIEKTRAFYKDFLGFGEPFELKNPDGSLALTFIKINDQQYIELFPGLQPGQDRLNHISLATDDAEALRKHLEAHGVAVPKQVPKGRIGNSNFTIKDPDGHSVEMVQYEPAGWSMREKGKYMPSTRISERMLHVGIIIGNIPAAMKFYGDLLGFPEIWRGSSDGVTLSWTNVRVPEGSDYIEFMLYKKLPAPDARTSQHHICLEVPDIHEALKKLEANPYRKTYTRTLEPRVGRNRRWQLNIYDPDGTRVELMEPKTVDGVPTPPSTAPPPSVE